MHQKVSNDPEAKEYIFVFSHNRYICVWSTEGDFGALRPADILYRYNVVIDDDCEFARIKRGDFRLIWHATAMRVTITIHNGCKA